VATANEYLCRLASSASDGRCRGGERGREREFATGAERRLLLCFRHLAVLVLERALPRGRGEKEGSVLALGRRAVDGVADANRASAQKKRRKGRREVPRRGGPGRRRTRSACYLSTITDAAGYYITLGYGRGKRGEKEEKPSLPCRKGDFGPSNFSRSRIVMSYPQRR